ncbi:thioredoxin-disulfide reductase [Desulfosporosinus sp. SB140]|uniref:thioredoxin-disulfide reductase n=1 Tax=Desulfosporosinus paludis TaxID=3115649 RepID=UPI0038910B8E
MEQCDLVIIGGGPAGLSAALYAGRSRLKTILIEKGKTGGQAATTEDILNYPGFPEGITGPELMERMTAQALKFGVEIIRDEAVKVEAEGNVRRVYGKRQSYEAKAIILAMGAAPKTLGVPGEGRLRGKGVSYCATCDGDMFTELDIIVVGNGDAALEEAVYLTKFADRVSIIVRRDEPDLRASKSIQEEAFNNPRINIIWSSVVAEILGEELVEAVRLRNVHTNELTEMETNGVFIYVGTLPKTEFVKDMLQTDDQGYILANEKMETSIPGVFTAGDIRYTNLRQVITAAGDGAIAATMAEKYMEELKKRG